MGGFENIKKELGKNIFGTTARKAVGPKSSRPGDPNTTSAKFVDAVPTQRQQWQIDWIKKLNDKALEMDSMLSRPAEELKKRGWRTMDEQRILDNLKRSNLT